MNDAIKSAILGLIEGLSEFLPISSTGHMLIAEPLLGIDPELPLWRAFLFVSQLGAILAVVVVFWRDLWQRVFKPVSRDWQNHIVVKLAVAMIPTIVGALLLEHWVERHLESGSVAPIATAAALIVGAGVMELIDRRFRHTQPMTLDDVSLKQAALIGLIQVISIWPGVSRAGATILGGMTLGLTPKVATEFSFYLAIPTMFAAAGYRLLKHGHEITTPMASVLLLGTAVAFVTALLVVVGFMGYVRRYRFTVFAIYRVLLGGAVLVWAYLR